MDCRCVPSNVPWHRVGPLNAQLEETPLLAPSCRVGKAHLTIAQPNYRTTPTPAGCPLCPAATPHFPLHPTSIFFFCSFPGPGRKPADFCSKQACQAICSPLVSQHIDPNSHSAPEGGARTLPLPVCPACPTEKGRQQAGRQAGALLLACFLWLVPGAGHGVVHPQLLFS